MDTSGRLDGGIGVGLHVTFLVNLFSSPCGIKSAADRRARSQDVPDRPNTPHACAHMEGKCLGW